MDDEDTRVLMKYVRGEISFSDWLELGIPVADGSTLVDQDENAASSDTLYAPDESSITLSETSDASTQELHSAPQLPSQSGGGGLPVRMTDLLLRDPVAERTRKHGGTSVDDFRKEIPMTSASRKERRKGYELPQHLRREMGQANIFCARGDYEKAKTMCMELIRQAPKCSEPFQTLGMIYEEQGDQERALQFFLIVAYLRKSGEIDEWLKLATMSIEQNNYKQALTCYSQALKVEPENVNVHWDRAALCYQTNDVKKAMEFYETLLKIFPDDASDKFFELATEMAGLYHEQNCIEKAIIVLEHAFSKHPTKATKQAVNVLAELYIASQNYGTALKVVCDHCNIRQLARVPASKDSTAEPLSSFSSLLGSSEDGLGEATDQRPGRVSQGPREWHVPRDTPIDLRVKAAVCVIHLQVGTVKNLLEPVFMTDAESVGDLYLDIAEAYIDKSLYEEALPILDSLVATQKFNQAGVWLRKAQSHNSLGNLEEAVRAYTRVVMMAPNHLDARLTLASLHQQLGQHDQAISVLSDRADQSSTAVPMETECHVEAHAPSHVVEAESQVVEPQEFRLLFHKCSILHAQGRMAEFREAGLHLCSLFFTDVYHRQELEKIAIHSRRYQVKCLKGPEPGDEAPKTGGASIVLQETGLRLEEWWEMFKKVVVTLSRLRHHADAEHVVLCGMTSSRFPPYESYVTELEVMCVGALFLTRKYRLAFDCLKLLISSHPENNVVWNMFARITAKTMDVRHHRYCIRLLLKNPDSLPLILSSGNNAFISGTYKFAIGEYIRAFRQKPTDPLLSLLLAIQYIHLACQKFPRSRHSCIIQSFIFLFQYMGLRGECQEVHYNLARAFHQIGLLQFAVHYYNKVLDTPPHGAEGQSLDDHVVYSDNHDLHREAAFNLSLIYKASGSDMLAAELMMKYCWV